MKASKVIALGAFGVLSVLSFNYALKVATDSLVVDRDEATALADAPPEAPRDILATATATPSMAGDGHPDEVLGAWGDDSFGLPDPDFGRADPAHGEPAWGAAEHARRAAAAASEATSEGGAEL